MVWTCMGGRGLGCGLMCCWKGAGESTGRSTLPRSEALLLNFDGLVPRQPLAVTDRTTRMTGGLDNNLSDHEL